MSGLDIKKGRVIFTVDKSDLTRVCSELSKDGVSYQVDETITGADYCYLEVYDYGGFVPLTNSKYGLSSKKQDRERLFGHSIPTFKYIKKNPSAVAPFKNRYSDVGFDLTIIKLHKQVGNIFYYDTGLGVEPPFGYYFTIEESGAHKKGISLRNKRGIIDPEYRGTLIVALEYDEGVSQLELPAVVVQMIPHMLVLMEGEETGVISDTTRQDNGGLGSKQFNK